MKIMKKIAIALLLVFCLSLSGCALIGVVVLGGGNDFVSKEEISEYVEGHIDALSAFPYGTYKRTTTDETKILFIKEALGQDTIVKRVYRTKPGILDFYCGGTGNVSSSTKCGFYYSEKDVPYAFEFEREAQLAQTSEDAYEWESEDRQKAFYTERILPRWFWYYLVWQ